MPAKRKLPDIADLAPEWRRKESIAVVAAGLVRLARATTPSVAPADSLAAMPTSMLAENPSEPTETGLEFLGETRLSVPAG